VLEESAHSLGEQGSRNATVPAALAYSTQLACTRLLAYVGLVVSLSGSVAFADVPRILILPAASAWEVWQPSESWPGGSQYDPRLDAAVRFWQAGIPIYSVLSGIREQTGVAVSADSGSGFRVCVTLYLNPDAPPTLRELLVQLQWATESTVLTRRSEAADRVYDVLLPRTGRSAPDELARATKEFWQQAHDQALIDAARVAAKIAEYREALAMTPAELLARYRDSDDVLLFSLLDPSRRAAVQFVDELPAEDLGSILRGQAIERDWWEWSDQSRALLAKALPFDSTWLKDGSVLVTVGLAGLQGIFVGASALSDAPDGGRKVGPQVSPTRHVGAVEGNRLLPDESAALAAYVSELLTPRDQLAPRTNLPENAPLTPGVGEAQPRNHGMRLSGTAEKRLASAAVSVDETGRYALWQVQEAVASSTGMHVISDCFWQPARSIRTPTGANADTDRTGPDECLEMSALELLLSACGTSYGSGSASLPFLVGEDDLSWEWEDRGQFLRFRARERALWRSGILPDAVLADLDQWYQKRGEIASDATWVPVQLRRLSEIVGRLNDAQVRYGGRLAYEDPAAVGSRGKAAFRGRILAIAGPPHRLRLFRVLSSLQPAQWELAGSTGLMLGTDLTPDQLGLLHDSGITDVLTTRLNERGLDAGLLTGARLSVGRAPWDMVLGDDGPDADMSAFIVRVSYRDAVLQDWRLPSVVRATAVPLAALPPGRAAFGNDRVLP